MIVAGAGNVTDLEFRRLQYACLVRGAQVGIQAEVVCIGGRCWFDLRSPSRSSRGSSCSLAHDKAGTIEAWTPLLNNVMNA